MDFILGCAGSSLLCRLSLAASGAPPSLGGVGLSLQWHLLLWAWALGRGGLSSFLLVGSGVAARGR